MTLLAAGNLRGYKGFDRLGTLFRDGRETPVRLPQSVGGFRLVELIGSGSFGTVYRAEVEGAMGFSQDVALKLLDPARAGDQPELVASLADEAALLSRIQHPNIVQVRGFERIEHDFLGTTYAMVMELVKGLPLRRLLDSAEERGVRFPIQACLLALAEAAEALQYAHEMETDDGRPMGLVHRDMKPANMLVTKLGRLKILDFGIAWAADRKVSATATGMTKGTVLYMSPEQIRGQPLDGRSDIYSLGLIFYEMLTGEFFVPLPDGGLSDIAGMLKSVAETTWDERIEVLRELLRAPTPDGHGLDDEQAGFIEKLLGEMLQRDPEERADAARLVALMDELGAAWRIKRGRSFLKDLVLAEYETYERIPVIRDGPSTTMKPTGGSSAKLARPPEEPASTPPAGRKSGGSAPVPPTRIMESSEAAAALELTRGGTPEPPDVRMLVAAVVGLFVLLAAVGIWLLPGEEASTSAGVVLPPLASEPEPPEPVETEPPAPVEEPILAGDDDDSGDAASDALDEHEDEAEDDEAGSEPATPARRAPRRAARKPAPKRTPKATQPTPAPEPTPEPASEPVAEVEPLRRAKVRVAHAPPRFVVPGSPLPFEVEVKTLSAGEACTPRLILAPKKRKKYRRYQMAEQGDGIWTTSVQVPYDEEWAAGVRYFVECCWEDDCDTRWKSPGAPHYLYPPDF